VRIRRRWVAATACAALIGAILAVKSDAEPEGRAADATMQPPPASRNGGIRPKRILSLPQLGSLSYRCDAKRHFSVTLALPRLGATEHVTIMANGRPLRRSVRVDPGEQLTTPFRPYRSQVWRLHHNHKPAEIKARIALRFKVDRVGDCFVTPLRAVVNTRSHAPRPAAQGRWRRLPEPNAARGQGFSAVEGVRVGRRAIFVAGASYRAKRVTGLSFDLRSRRWRRLATSPLRWRAGQTVVAAGSEAIVWGGAAVTAEPADGARFDPVKRSWNRVAPSPLRPRTAHTAVWTGKRMLVWGGTSGREALVDGAAYDPPHDSWRPIAKAPLHPRGLHVAIWTGRQMIVWGGDVSGRSSGEQGRYASDGAAYQPATDRWTRIARAPIRSTGSSRAVWTGNSMIVWTGTEGALYKPATNRWRRIPPPPLSARAEQTAVWSGSEMLVWGGTRRPCGDCFRADGAAYDPSTNRWRLLPRSTLAGRDRHAAIAIKDGMLVWGGCCAGTTRHFADGAVYRSP